MRRTRRRERERDSSTDEGTARQWMAYRVSYVLPTATSSATATVASNLVASVADSNLNIQATEFIPASSMTTMTEDSLECEEDATIAVVDYSKSVPRADSARYSRRLVDRARQKEKNDSRHIANDDQTATAEEPETVRMTDSTEKCQNESVKIGRTANDIFDEVIMTMTVRII